MRSEGKARTVDALAYAREGKELPFSPALKCEHETGAFLSPPSFGMLFLYFSPFQVIPVTTMHAGCGLEGFSFPFLGLHSESGNSAGPAELTSSVYIIHSCTRPL